MHALPPAQDDEAEGRPVSHPCHAEAKTASRRLQHDLGPNPDGGTLTAPEPEPRPRTEPLAPRTPAAGPPAEPPVDVPPAQPTTSASKTPAKAATGRTRMSSLWMALIGGAVVLVLLLVFILLNSGRVEVNFFGAHWTVPLGVALLLAAALGVLLVVVPGVGRIIQLRRAARQAHRRADALEQSRPESAGRRYPGR